MFLKPLFLLLILLAGGNNSLSTGDREPEAETLSPPLTGTGAVSSWQSCRDRVDTSTEYCCYNKKCWGQGDLDIYFIDCDSEWNSCTVDADGYPKCIRDAEGGSYGICAKKSGWKGSCVYNYRGEAEKCSYSKENAMQGKCSGTHWYNYLGYVMAGIAGLVFLCNLLAYLEEKCAGCARVGV